MNIYDFLSFLAKSARELWQKERMKTQAQTKELVPRDCAQRVKVYDGLYYYDIGENCVGW